ncbi:hypothetical protein [Tenacibaculum sp. M341]|uniref:hypothetical protein n=1 Tax=Tenacibaculum sp. M341 TaxID=2530339 RepID=UPI00104D3C21|nr:hypothetical protein [Tenacibaculum sp. M341]TCI93033.1 hypothetical protein EYW44_05280 [Tenacibaculum sp. M341]
MIVFYTPKKETLTLKPVVSCDTACAANCIKPKNKCCNKYKKKGINCKRCPLTYTVKIAS